MEQNTEANKAGTVMASKTVPISLSDKEKKAIEAADAAFARDTQEKESLAGEGIELLQGIIKGVGYTEIFESGPHDTQVKGKKVIIKVKIRALSDMEIQSALIKAYDHVTDKKTVADVILERIGRSDYTTDQINALLSLRMWENIYIVYTAVKDFYPETTVKDVSEMVGLNDIVERIKNISGIGEKSGRIVHFLP
jgi:hypothetical protein